MRDLTAFQRDLVYVIADMDEPNGLEVKDRLEEYYDDEIRHGRLYPNLDTLVERGLVEKGMVDQRTNKYILTRAGKTTLGEHLDWVTAATAVEA